MVDTMAQGTKMKKSIVPRVDSWLNSFVTLRTENEDMIVWCFRSLIRDEFTKERQNVKACNESVMQVTVKTFLKWPDDLQEEVMVNNGSDWKVWIVLEPLLAMC